MDTTRIKVNIKTVVNTKHNIENMIKRRNTTKTIIKNTKRITSIIQREITTIKRQEIQAGQEHIIATAGKEEVVTRRVFNLS